MMLNDAIIRRPAIHVLLKKKKYYWSASLRPVVLRKVLVWRSILQPGGANPTLGPGFLRAPGTQFSKGGASFGD